MEDSLPTSTPDPNDEAAFVKAFKDITTYLNAHGFAELVAMAGYLERIADGTEDLPFHLQTIGERYLSERESSESQPPSHAFTALYSDWTRRTARMRLMIARGVLWETALGRELPRAEEFAEGFAASESRKRADVLKVAWLYVHYPDMRGVELRQKATLHRNDLKLDRFTKDSEYESAYGSARLYVSPSQSHRNVGLPRDVRREILEEAEAMGFPRQKLEALHAETQPGAVLERDAQIVTGSRSA